jgi:hypothetical protein
MVRHCFALVSFSLNYCVRIHDLNSYRPRPIAARTSDNSRGDCLKVDFGQVNGMPTFRTNVDTDPMCFCAHTRQFKCESFGQFFSPMLCWGKEFRNHLKVAVDIRPSILIEPSPECARSEAQKPTA